jgi:diadenosine tetraphosphate (Ap4A) HIT family hydrolase
METSVPQARFASSGDGVTEDVTLKRTWPEDWDSRKRGDSCPFCADLSERSFYSGRISEALLERNAIAKGHAAVVFRGRHVASFTDLAAGDLEDYWKDVQSVARMLERVFRPCHMNYMLLGNIVPHLHVHVVPRYLDDAAPERPLPWTPSEIPANLYASQIEQLKEASAFLIPNS